MKIWDLFSPRRLTLRLRDGSATPAAVIRDWRRFRLRELRFGGRSAAVAGLLIGGCSSSLDAGGGGTTSTGGHASQAGASGLGATGGQSTMTTGGGSAAGAAGAALNGAGDSNSVAGAGGGSAPGGAGGGGAAGSGGATGGSTPITSFAVVTDRYDNTRSGANTAETQLATSNVSPAHFGLLFSRSISGFVYGQPLYAGGISLGGVKHNVVYVATEHNMVYAFDADSASFTISAGPVNIH